MKQFNNENNLISPNIYGSKYFFFWYICAKFHKYVYLLHSLPLKFSERLVLVAGLSHCVPDQFAEHL